MKIFERPQWKDGKKNWEKLKEVRPQNKYGTLVHNKIYTTG